jgi:hypothetical protein
MQGAKDLFIRRWKKYIDHDPDLNPNINKDNAFYEVSETVSRYN